MDAQEVASVLPPVPKIPALYSVRGFALRYPEIVSEATLRNLIAARVSRNGNPPNGFARVMVRIGSKILLDEKKFFEWMKTQARKNGR